MRRIREIARSYREDRRIRRAKLPWPELESEAARQGCSPADIFFDWAGRSVNQSTEGNAMTEKHDRPARPEQPGKGGFEEGQETRPDDKRVGQFSDGNEALPDDDRMGQFSDGNEALPDDQREGQFSDTVDADDR